MATQKLQPSLIRAFSVLFLIGGSGCEFLSGQDALSGADAGAGTGSTTGTTSTTSTGTGGGCPVGGINAVFTSNVFGQIRNSLDPRIMQFALKYTF